MVRLRFIRRCIRPVALLLLLGMFSLMLMTPPVTAGTGPPLNINPRNTVPTEEHPWADYSDGLTERQTSGGCYMVVRVAGWLIDCGLIDTGDTDRAESANTVNQKRNTANGTDNFTDAN